MTHPRVPPPREEACLSRPYPSSQKGGTRVFESVTTLAVHLERLAAPDGYRPGDCPGCGCRRLHAHDRRTRSCRQLGISCVVIRRYRCTACEARWQVLPGFVARHLWHHWPQVQQGCERAAAAAPREGARGPSKRTRQRWRRRLVSSALVLVQLLATSAVAPLQAAAQAAGFDATRRDVVDVLGRPFAEVAALMHRLMPGIRLM